MKVAISYSSKNRLELTRQTLPKPSLEYDLFWNDGSTDAEARDYFETAPGVSAKQRTRVTGGADPAIVFALTQMLKGDYEILGLWENDVAPVDGWLEKTLALFDRGRAEGLAVGAVSPRCYSDRILIQRDGYAVMLNLGAGIVLFTRPAAELVLKFYRTGWWSDTRRVFSLLSGIDVGRYAAFRGNEQHTSCDWHWDAVLAQHGLAALALTPSPVQMVGQDPPLEEQGLELTSEPLEERRDPAAFETFRHHTRCVREGRMKIDVIRAGLRTQGASTYFAHQLSRLGAVRNDDWRVKWIAGFGGFAFTAKGTGKITVPLFGPVAVMASGGDSGATVKITDRKSGFEIAPQVEPEGPNLHVLNLNVPGGMAYRDVEIEISDGGRLFAIQMIDAQPEFPGIKFDYNSLPRVE